MKKRPHLYENELIDLGRLVEIEQQEKMPDTIEQIRALQEDQVARIVKQREEEKEELRKLRDKFNIVCEIQNELTFKDLMIVKTRTPGFFYEFKKNIT